MTHKAYFELKNQKLLKDIISIKLQDYPNIIVRLKRCTQTLVKQLKRNYFYNLKKSIFKIFLKTKPSLILEYAIENI